MEDKFLAGKLGSKVDEKGLDGATNDFAVVDERHF